MSGDGTGRGSADRHDDRGQVLVMVLLMTVISALVVVPLLSYTSTVLRAGRVQTDKAESIALARGATWVALSRQSDLYDHCDGGTLPGSLTGVTTTCTVLATETLRPAAETPYHVATLRSDTQVPAEIVAGLADPSTAYVNPNSTVTNHDDYDLWLDLPEWSAAPVAGTVWLPELPVRATSSGGTRDTAMPSDPLFLEPGYSECRVLFPGTFDTPLTLNGPTYFTSGVYYFTAPIHVQNGADVVVGNGAEGGCTTDFDAIAYALAVPEPLNMSGLGGTFVFGGSARLVIDDSAGPGDIRFAMNQRYVAEDEANVAASAGVSIVSVNGEHEPFAPGETLGDDLDVDGVLGVPASTVGVEGSPLAALSDYLPSVLTPKAIPPGKPINIVAADWMRKDPDEGRLYVAWDAPDDNGSPITGYVVTDRVTGKTCRPPTPVLPDTTVPTACTIVDVVHPEGVGSEIVVTAVSEAGSTDSDVVAGPSVHIEGDKSPEVEYAERPENLVVGAVYSDGVEISWDPPSELGAWPVYGYRVTAFNDEDPDVVCEAWWDETSCVLPGPFGEEEYKIEVVALQQEQELDPPSPPVTWESDPEDMKEDLAVDPLADPAPVQVPDVVGPRLLAPILDLTTETAVHTEVSVAGYVAVPQGHVDIAAASPDTTSVSLIGGVVAGEIALDGAVPTLLDVRLDNPVAQKRVRIQSSTTGAYAATSDAVVQVNRSGSIAINSWVVQ